MDGGVIFWLIIITAFITYLLVYSCFDERLNKIDNELKQKIIENVELKNEKTSLEQIMYEKSRIYENFKIEISNGMNYLAELISDFSTAEYEISAKYLENKKKSCKN